MKNPAPYLRRTLFSLLDGNVTYETAVVPVYEGEGEVLPRQIIIGDYSDGDRSNKHGFEVNASQLVEFFCKKITGIKKHVDAMGEILENLIHQTTKSILLSGPNLNVCVRGRL